MLQENIETEQTIQTKNPPGGWHALPSFSHIYIEQDAFGYPVTEQLLQKFARSRVVEIKSYKEIFNRPRQDWASQKMSQKLILAKKRDGFLYEGSPQVQNFGYLNYYYNSLVLNCPYNCHYCYLQGMYPSANIVGFVNLDDFFESTTNMLQQKGSIYLCISYDTDLLAVESLFGYCKEWVRYAANNKRLAVELRTKSVNFGAIRELTPPENFTLAWTLSPQEIIEKYEPKTPGLAARIAAINEALRCGWKIRLCFDPILAVDNWMRVYREMINQVTSAIPLDQVQDITLGVFRINTQYFKDMRKRVKWPLLYEPFQKTSQMVTYNSTSSAELIGYMERCLMPYFPKEKIFSHRTS